MAIAYDSASKANSGNWLSSTSISWSHTCSGSNRLLVVYVFTALDSTDKVTGVTYNGVSMTRDYSVAASGYVSRPYVYSLVNPSTGANNVVVSMTASTYTYAGAASYTGVAQSSPFERAAYSEQSSLTLSTTTTQTTTTNNAWGIGWSFCSSALTQSFDKGSNRLWDTSASLATWDSNADITPAGSYGVTASIASAGNWMFTVAIYKPFTSTQNSNFLAFF